MALSELPPQVLKLTRHEQKLAAPFYSRNMAIFMGDRPGEYDDNLRRALNGTYVTAARSWFGPAGIFGLPAAIILSFGPSLVGFILLGMAGVFFCGGVWRLIQALHFYPQLGMRRVRLTKKHPTPYD
jgi:hypothetical protein